MWEKTLLEFALLTGFAALVAFVVNALKVFGVVKDDDAQTWSAGFNLLGILALYIFRLFQPDYPLGAIDTGLMQLATIGTYIMAFVVQLGVSKVVHIFSRGVPLIGKSFSFDAMKRQDRLALKE